MGWMSIVIAFLIAFLGFCVYRQLSIKRPQPAIPKVGYFGRGAPKADDPAIHPFRVNVSDAQLEELKSRLQNTRITHEQLEDVDDFTYGFNLKTLIAFQDFWLHTYNWRAEEKLLNRFDQFTTEIEGLRIHFVHEKPPANAYDRVMPLLLSHGWPGSTHEFHKIIPMLTDPRKHLGIESDFAFEVVTPSIPGFGFSEAAHKRGMSQAATGRIFHELACRLGFKKYIVQGGDHGAIIVSQMARLFPDRLYGIHINMHSLPYTSPGYMLRALVGSFFPRWMFESKEFANFSLFRILRTFVAESGYYHIQASFSIRLDRSTDFFCLQATKPDTLGVALNDSPLGLLAYILEKFSTATNLDYRRLPDGGLESKGDFTKEELITAVMIYWINGNMLQATRFYKESFDDEANRLLTREFVHTPTGYAALENDAIPPQPRELASLLYNVTHYTFVKNCGHFAALQCPRELAADIFSFARTVI
ncbi:Epoxide hydrolase [Aphelenchoides fujianensis]|nr:Epoxide hydrolase [Aphelenchoides fujianensis]